MKSTILFIVNDIHFKGGGERVTTNLANWFTSNGYEVTILSMSCPKKTSLFQLNDSVKLDYLSVNNTKVISKFLVFLKLRRYIHNRSFNYVFGIGTYANVLLGLIKSRHSKFIGCEHNSFDSVSFVWSFLRRLTYPTLSATVVLTQTDFEKMKRLNNYTFIIPNSVSIPSVYSDCKSRNILAIGKFYYQKGFDLMIDAFYVFSKIIEDWNLIIVGDGPEKQQMIKRVNELGLSKRVSLKPFTYNIGIEYLNASVYLMTSRFEGLPMVLLEAQSYGLPIVAYDCDTGPRDVVINNRNGFLVPFNSEEILVDSLQLLCKNEKLRNEMSSYALEDRMRFRPDFINEKWINLFNEIL